MTRSHGEELTPYDPEIERTFHRRKNNIERGENSGETDPEEQLVIVEPTMEAIGAAERPMMEYSFHQLMGRPLASSSLPLKLTILKSNRQSFKLFGPVCNSLVYLMRTRINILLIFLRFVILLGLMVVTLANRATLMQLQVAPFEKTTEAFNIIDEIATNLSNFNPYSNTYNPGWRSHPNFSWSNNQQQGPARPLPPRQPPPQEPKSNLEEMFSKFITATDTRFQNQDASIRNIEMQLGQLVSMVSGRREGQLPSDTEKNPKEQVNAVTLKNGKTLGEEPPRKQMEETPDQEKEELKEETKGSPLKLNVDTIPPYIPYPKRVLKANLDKQFGKFLEIFKKIHVNIPLIDALSQMPSYAKFLKEVISNKRKWENGETVKLNEECSAILQNKLPPKLKDPGSFSIPCTIGDMNFEKALCDLGASINLMPYSIFAKLGMHELTPTIVTLQLADRSINTLGGL
ncbi:UNVERIFIED_CONTAM: hypothetical protein Sradi_7201700 [Sesamum radiatum]|uniref:Uncharacterized protein n=1 Tax=Sesamum radiatum TaxID=300843 RepID=A0AAW2IQJ3_SESRA